MKQIALALLISSFLVACGGTPPSNNKAIGGTVYAPAGGSVQNTVVLACFVVGDSCDNTKSDGVTITQSGSKASYSIPNLAPGQYAVVALQGQFDNQGDLTALESLGIYLNGNNAGQEFTPVQPGGTGIDIKLVNLANPDAGGAPVQPGPGTALPQELQGEFFVGSPSSSDFYNPVTHTFAPASGSLQSYTFKPDGTFRLDWLYQTSFYGCNSTLSSSSSGTVQLNGTQMVLNTTAGWHKFTNSCNASQNQDRAVPLKSTTQTWRVAPDPDYPSITYLYLRDANGNEPRFVKKQ